jgi:hypothetical protein
MLFRSSELRARSNATRDLDLNVLSAAAHIRTSKYSHQGFRSFNSFEVPVSFERGCLQNEFKRFVFGNTRFRLLPITRLRYFCSSIHGQTCGYERCSPLFVLHFILQWRNPFPQTHRVVESSLICGTHFRPYTDLVHTGDSLVGEASRRRRTRVI